MSSDNHPLTFSNVWKKYSKEAVFHRSVREDISNIFTQKSIRSELSSDEFWALKGITFSIARGETVGLYGPNGAGKSTILKLMANVTFPTAGTVTVHGRLAPLIEIGAGFHPDLSGRENIFMNGAILGMKIPEIRKKMDSIITFSEIPDFIDMPVKKFSSGMYLRLAFSIAIHSDAEIYLIDEILTVGDELFQKKCLDKLTELKKKRKTMVLVSHDRPLMEKLVDRVIYLKKGEQSSL